MGIFNFLKRPPEGSEPTVRVEFVNQADNSTLGVSNMPVSKLPESFAIDTTLDIQNQKWSVTAAEPTEKVDFLKTGRLKLVLSRLSFENPENILFSLPTISNDVGRVEGDALPNDRIFLIHEDDWRQAEFVSKRFGFEIDQELSDIAAIWKSQRSGPGFKTLHVRERIREPLVDSLLRLDDLKKIVPPRKQFDAVGFLNSPGTIPQSFAWGAWKNLIVWGLADTSGKVLRLSLRGSPNPEHVAEASTSLATISERYQLQFIDWCRIARISDAVTFQKYFTPQK